MRIKLYMTLNRIFIDTSFFKAISDKNDGFHTASIKILKKIKSHKYEFITTNYVLDETYTLIRTRCGYNDVIEFHNGLFANMVSLQVVRVESDDEIKGWEFFLKKWSKLSFTDCTSFAVMKRLELVDVATFDHHFAQAGFKPLK